MKNGFTLAEVLITLGIIGVVAAMTIPTLMTNINGAKYRNHFKKSLSTLNQAVKLNEANYEYNFASVESNCINEHTDNPENVMSVCAIFNGSMSGISTTNYTKLKTSKNTLYYQDLYYKGNTPDTLIKEQGVNLFYFQMKDGAFFAIHSPFGGQAYISPCTLNNNTRTLEQAMQDTNFQKYCVGWIDVNGVSLPNKEVRCSDGKSHSKDIGAECIVPNKAANMTDVFPVVIYDGTVAPGSAAARYLLNNAK